MSALLEELQSRGSQAGQPDQPKTTVDELVRIAREIEGKATEHLKLILTQFSEYDLHDSVHSKKVLLNIEQLLGPEKIKALSVYELFFLFSAAWLHDIGMALPSWELKLIDAIEGNGDPSANWQKEFFSEEGHPISFTEAERLVRKHANEIYGRFEEQVTPAGTNNVKSWFFSPESEAALIKDLSEMTVSYRKFRSGFAQEMDSRAPETKSKFVKELRMSFIRQQHPSRAHFYIKNLAKYVTTEKLPSWIAITEDLADICKSHGESITAIEKLNCNAIYSPGGETANLQFLAQLLRIADILHCDTDRAPSVLFHEIQFDTRESPDHWRTKQQGVQYNISHDNNSRTSIKFTAFCKDPKHYYALLDYLNMVDEELANYNKLLTRWRTPGEQNSSSKYDISLANEVNRSGIRYDQSKFTPVHGLSFKLDQRRILELLMGVQLYKDPYACLRELYQNSLDACKAMRSYSENPKSGEIVFWLEKREQEGAYLCCRDNGVGMTKEIIEKYLLNIGNSYYKSSDFQRTRAQYGHSFTPTSQFGIGILSCFMIGDALEITTKPMQEISTEVNAICLVVNGVHANAYYKTVDRSDEEKIGRHGTIVRIQLKPEIRISNNLEGMSWFRSFVPDYVYPNLPAVVNKTPLTDLNNHIFHIISKFIGLPKKETAVSVILDNNDSLPILRCDESHQNLDRLSDIEKRVLQDIVYPKSLSPVKTYPITVSQEGIFFSSEIPLSSFTGNTYIASSRDSYGIFVDGICLNTDDTEYFDPIDAVNGGDNSEVDLRAIRWLSDYGHLDFSGRQRPLLSVERTRITSLPKDVLMASDELLKKVITKHIEVIKTHLIKETCGDCTKKNYLFSLIWEDLASTFVLFPHRIINALLKDPYFSGIVLNRITNLTQDPNLTLGMFFEEKEICLNNLAPAMEDNSILMLYNVKCSTAERISLQDSGVSVKHDKTPVTDDIGINDTKALLILCDDWNSSRFKEFDIVTSLWPFIPKRLFSRLLLYASIDKNSTHQINLSPAPSEIQLIGTTDSRCIHPRLGMYHPDKYTSYRYKRLMPLVGSFSSPIENVLLDEINAVSETIESVCALFVYIAPCTLTVDEEKILSSENEAPFSPGLDRDNYEKGIREGWSILFLGLCHPSPIIVPGLISRATMIGGLSDEVWSEIGTDKLFFLDGTLLSRPCQKEVPISSTGNSTS